MVLFLTAFKQDSLQRQWSRSRRPGDCRTNVLTDIALPTRSLRIVCTNHAHPDDRFGHKRGVQRLKNEQISLHIICTDHARPDDRFGRKREVQRLKNEQISLCIVYTDHACTDDRFGRKREVQRLENEHILSAMATHSQSALLGIR